MMSIRGGLEKLQARHMQFIEANYHIWHPRLIRERRLLMTAGEVASEVWVEASPTYQRGPSYAQLGLPSEVVDILDRFATHDLVFNPPYEHQAEALVQFFKMGKDLVVSTGTGSGKTEIFLYTLLGLLAEEAKRGRTTSMRGFRAIILYPMNALVADQLGRMRRLLGSPEAADALQELFGRRVQFGMYTSRTPYHGRYDPDRNDKLVQPIIDFFLTLQTGDPELFSELKKRGRVPAKDLVGYRGDRSRISRFRTQPFDSELFTRQEMHSPNEFGGTPDVLITNYSMLEYMLLRPIEQPFFVSTRKWLEADEKNKLLVVIDEAHLYRGAQGAEVALLIRRLLQHLGVQRERLRFILSSASLGTHEVARASGPLFASDLTASRTDDFSVVVGSKVQLQEGAVGSDTEARTLGGVSLTVDHSRVLELARALGWSDPVPSVDEEVRLYLGRNLESLPVFRRLYNAVTSAPFRIGRLADHLFPSCRRDLAEEATLKLLHLGSQAFRLSNERVLPARVHMFFKGLPRLFVCTNSKCSERRSKEGPPLLGRIYAETRSQCSCGARVFELLTDRNCGAAYLKVFRRNSDRQLDQVFLWTEANPVEGFEEVHLLVETPRQDTDPNHSRGAPLIDQFPPYYLDLRTGHLLRRPPAADCLPVWAPMPGRPPADPNEPWTWSRCPACGITSRKKGGRGSIMDLETKGEETFANLIKEVFQFQPEVLGHERFPNRGRKVLCFSDSRQKAARLARDLQRNVERDSFREMLVLSTTRLPSGAPLTHLFPAFAASSEKMSLNFFDDGDYVIDGYSGSRTVMVGVKGTLFDVADRYGISANEIAMNADAADELNRNRPRQYDSSLLRMLGDKYYSLEAAMVAYLEPTAEVLDHVVLLNPETDRELLREILVTILHNAAGERAVDAGIHELARRRSRATAWLPLGRERDDGEGLRIDELIPADLPGRLAGIFPTTGWDNLRRSLIASGDGGRVPRLFEPATNRRWMANSHAISLHVAVNENWHRCLGCRQFYPVSLAGRCPGCGGVLASVERDDLHLAARKNLWREPCEGLLRGSHQPMTLRSEEHSAQLSAKDYSDVFSKSERYELEFQDVMTSETPEEQPVDVLCCTTTMEVGIDIGSLTAVAMRTVPPLPANYQQRSGRAGRRGAALSMIVTFADNSPHETLHFHHPERLVGAEVARPSIYVNNARICERHINATLLERFFLKAPVSETADVFSSLGAAGSFFRGKGPYSLEEFREWVKNEILVRASVLTKRIGSLLPPGLRSGTNLSDNSWRESFVQETAQQLLIALRKLSDNESWSEMADGEHTLLNALLDAGLLPTFSFPIDVCTFTINALDRERNRVRTSYEMSQGLQQALSEYAPGRQIVVDKKTFISYGLHFPFSRDPVNRASDQGWDDVPWLNHCTRCGTVMAEQARDLGSENFVCPIPGCGAPIESIPIYTPFGFSPEVDPTRGLLEGEEPETERVYATSAKFPLPVQGNEDEEGGLVPRLARCQLRSMSNQELIVANFGPDDAGFEVCTSCGAAAGAGNLRTPHNRPYPRSPYAKGRSWPNRCNGPSIVTAFGHNFHTDLAVVRGEWQSPMNFAPLEKWFKSACYSLSEALVLGATRALRIDSAELGAGYRVAPPLSSDSDSMTGYVEFFLYDKTPGGAGFSSAAFESFQAVLDATKELLVECTCGQSCHNCLRTYQNRIGHLELDRHLALALLEYLRTGALASLDPHSCESMLRTLGDTIRLVDSSATAEFLASPSPNLLIALGDRRIRVEVQSCLLEQREIASDRFLARDYDILHDLPMVSHRILDFVGS